jgi:hypothetical protein
MNIQTFLNLTATTPARDLRRALAAALVVERPIAGEGYARLYRRVIAALGIASHTDHGQYGKASTQMLLAGVLEHGIVDSTAERRFSSRI